MDVIKRYNEAKEYYQKIGVNTDEVIKKLENIKISVNCWQGDDVTGNEYKSGKLSGGIEVNGNYIGKAQNMDQLRDDLSFVLKYLPGKHKVNLHAIYGDFDQDYSRDKVDKSHFSKWLEWAKKEEVGIDFNPTLFSHDMASDNLTLSHPNKEIRDYWIEHCINSYEIAKYFAQELNQEVLNNLWIPDGLKDNPANRMMLRSNLKDSLDKIYAQCNDNPLVYNSVESKVFGIGLESCTIGSHEFYLQYAQQNNLLCLLDNGHFHPTENIADKISSLLLFNEKLALHLTRSVRWDSDHVIRLNDEIKEILDEIAKYNAYERVFIGVDFFDASINRIVAWIIGTRNVLKAALQSLLIPHDLLDEAQEKLDYTKIMMIQEEMKSYPFNDIWNYYCYKNNVEYSNDWYNEVMEYESTTLRKRDNNGKN